MSTSPTDARPTRPGLTDADTYLVRLAHRSMREDTRALALALRRLPNGSTRGARRLRTWFVRFEAVMAHHQTEEDEIFWPALAEVAPAFAASVAALEVEHDELDRSVSACGHALEAVAGTGRAAEREAAVAAAERLVRVVADHLDHEDRTYVPAYQAAIDPETHGRLSAAAVASVPPALMAFIGPWFLDHATGEDRARLVASVPAPKALVVQGPLTVRYRRLARDVRAARSA